LLNGYIEDTKIVHKYKSNFNNESYLCKSLDMAMLYYCRDHKGISREQLHEIVKWVEDSILSDEFKQRTGGLNGFHLNIDKLWID
jgi:hypothetical protein